MGSDRGQTGVRPGSDPRLTPIAIVLLLAAAGCSRAAAPLEARLITDGAAKAYVSVTGLSSSELSQLRTQATSDLPAIFDVTVAGTETLPVAGRYVVTGSSVDFHPQFPFDRGRAYRVRFDASRLPKPRAEPPLTVVVQVPAAAQTTATSVLGLSPSATTWPENTLRFYINFSAPMSRTSALRYVQLEEENGTKVKEPFLPLDVDLWNSDRTRFTVFFDPGRVKRGIRPNVELGRALVSGRKYVMVVDAAWPDAAGRPLTATFRFPFTAGPAQERAVTPAQWDIGPPPPDTRESLAVTFQWPLDNALLQRGIGVATADGAAISGEAQVDDFERRWRFTPRDPWKAGQYQLVVLKLLEDPAGNRVGRPFEIEMFQKSAATTGEQVTVPFVIKPRD